MPDQKSLQEDYEGTGDGNPNQIRIFHVGLNFVGIGKNLEILRGGLVQILNQVLSQYQAFAAIPEIALEQQKHDPYEKYYESIRGHANGAWTLRHIFQEKRTQRERCDRESGNYVVDGR